MKRNNGAGSLRYGKVASASIASMSMLILVGCAYVLQPLTLPSQHRLRLIAKSPAQYSIRVWDKEYPVGADGKASIEFPATPRGCRIYLFNHIPINRVEDPLKTKSIFVVATGKTVQTLSLHEVSKLPVDDSVDHLLHIRDGR